MDRLKHRVWNEKRRMYLNQRDTAVDQLGDLYEVKHELKPLNPEIHVVELCSGERDKANNLVFEGDVLRIGEAFVYVYFANGSFSVGCRNQKYHRSVVQILLNFHFKALVSASNIVGNVHEDHDILCK